MKSNDHELKALIAESRQDRLDDLIDSDGPEMADKIMSVIDREARTVRSAYASMFEQIGEVTGADGVASMELMMTSALQRGIQLGRRIERGEI